MLVFKRQFLMKQLRMMGVNVIGLKSFYVENVGLLPILSYASPVWFIFISVADKSSLEMVQKSATRTFLLSTESYADRLYI